MKDQLAALIIERLSDEKVRLKRDFFNRHYIKIARHFALDNLLPTEIAERVYGGFPHPRDMRKLSNYGELKLKFSHIKQTSPLIQHVHEAIQDPKVVAIIEEITEIKNQVPDMSRYAGGVSTLLKGYYINPHLDHSHDVDRKLYRTVNVLYYVSPNWCAENGGNYELWDESVKNRIVVPSLFNRLVVMETNRTSWHAVNPVLCDAPRCCIYNYFFSEQSPEGEEYFHGPSSLFLNPLFRPRPEQRIRRAISFMRNSILGK